jgi:hypothetical protein
MKQWETLDVIERDPDAVLDHELEALADTIQS